MAQPVWTTSAGQLGVIPEAVFYQLDLAAYDPDGRDVFFRVVAGSLPDGLQCTTYGTLVGIPLATAYIQGVPALVNRDVTSKFVIRAYTVDINNNPARIADRTFEITVTGNNVPEFVTPAGSIGTYYDGDAIDFQIEFTDNDPGDVNVVRIVSGELPVGVTVTPRGLITGQITPAANVDEPPGYDLTPIYVEPYDFVVSAINKNYQFTLEVTDGKTSNLRTFEFFVYDRSTLTADDTTIDSDDTQVTADETTIRPPFVLNKSPTDLGQVRGDNYYAYQFVGEDFDTTQIQYAISVNQGIGLPPGLQLDAITGWYYGYIPDQGVTEVTYSFYITVQQTDAIGTPITCTATTYGTNRVTCASTAQLGPGTPIRFTGTEFGGISTAATQIYYVDSVINSTLFTVMTNADSTSSLPLTTAAGSMTCELIIVSPQYPFTVTIVGTLDAEVTWLNGGLGYYLDVIDRWVPAPTATKSLAGSYVSTTEFTHNLGTIENGATSLFKIQAVNRGGRVLTYRLKSGAYNELPQGLTLLPTGEIAGRVSFDTFAVDLGYTTFDSNTTTWDSLFTFTVNAYAEDTEQVLYKVDSVNIVSGGTGYSNVTPPTIEFSTPIGASAVQAQAGSVTVVSGAITSVALSDQGAGYTSPATISIVQGFGGSGANLTAVMAATGTRDVVSVFKTFTIQVVRAYNRPYQNLLIEAMPPLRDRVVISELLNNTAIFVPDFIFRPTDPNFGKATQVIYEHAYGLAPATLDRYVESLYENHYWKNLVLGQIETAQALDADGNVIYEVVYSKIVDNLVNSAGDSVNKIVTLPYAIIDPMDGSTEIRSVYPNSLVNMRDQVVDVVGQVSTKLPLWMTSKQTNGRVLGFTPAWVLCYTNPGKSAQIAYYINQESPELNSVDFKVDRYVLDRVLSRNWDTVTQRWIPTANLTTFDRFNTSGYVFIGQVDIATNLAFTDVNQRTLEYINNLGGLDGRILGVNGNTIIFINQEFFPDYPSIAAAWQRYDYPYSNTLIDGAPGSFDHDLFDQATTVPGGDFSTVDQRMAIYTISVDPVSTLVTLTLTTQPEEFDWVEITRGSENISGQFYYPASPGEGLTRISWLPLITETTVETIFDQASLAFVEPVDMYDTSDSLDKYLVFPRTNILV